MKNIIFIAPPLAGKGTLSDRISEKFNIPHIATGQLLRNKIKAGDEFAIKLKSIINAGKLIDDEIMSLILKERLVEEDCKNGYILDGYPRNVSQAIVYENILKELNFSLGTVIKLDVDYEIAKKRLAGRLSCMNCGRVYNEHDIETSPKVKGICDKCGNSLIRREDDVLETLEERYEEYQTFTAPLIDFYESKNQLITFNSNGGVYKIMDNIIEKLVELDE